MRLIDADALKHELCIRQHMLNADSLWKTLEIMDAQPTADVVERKKGKWIEKWNGHFKTNVPRCSLCSNASPFKYNYCPTCGADMREEKQKKGTWIWGDGIRCSNCNYKLQTTGLPSCCPNCFAEMCFTEIEE